MAKKFQIGKNYTVDFDYDRIYTLEDIQGAGNHTPSQGVIYLLIEAGRLPKTVRRNQYVFTEKMAQSHLFEKRILNPERLEDPKE